MGFLGLFEGKNEKIKCDRCDELIKGKYARVESYPIGGYIKQYCICDSCFFDLEGKWLKQKEE